MPMTISRKGKRRIRRFFVTCCRGAITFLRMERVYYRISEVRVELYTDQKDLAAERKMEDALDAAGVFYNKTETWIESEKLYEVLYSFEMEGVGNVYKEE